MNFSVSPRLRAAAGVVGPTATGVTAAPVQSGVLECNVAPGIGFIVGSSKNLPCVFPPALSRPEYYTGRINRTGLDIGVTGPGRFAWGVVTAGPPGRLCAVVGDYGVRALVSRWPRASAPTRSLAAMLIR